MPSSRRRPRRARLKLLPLGLLVLLAVAGGVRTWQDRRGPSAQPLPGRPLKAAAPGDVRVGTAVDDTALRREPGYRTVLAREFGSLTPENAMKWDALEPTRGKLDWAAADRAVDFATKHDMAVRGHTFVWYVQYPGWLEDLPRPELRQVLKAHIQTTMRRYRGRVRTWDVANEVVADDGQLRDSFWLRRLGTDYVRDAYRWARAADPDARLVLNEIGAEAPGPKSDELLRLARELKADGLLDGVGFQGHFSLQGVPDGFRANLERFAALGLDVELTEVDVALPAPAGEDALRRQAAILGRAVGDCRAVARCRGVTFWGFTDRHSWIPGNQPGFGAATLLDEDLRAKPAYRAVQRALAGQEP